MWNPSQSWLKRYRTIVASLRLNGKIHASAASIFLNAQIRLAILHCIYRKNAKGSQLWNGSLQKIVPREHRSQPKKRNKQRHEPAHLKVTDFLTLVRNIPKRLWLETFPKRNPHEVATPRTRGQPCRIQAVALKAVTRLIEVSHCPWVKDHPIV